MAPAVEPSSTLRAATSPRSTDDEVRERAVKIYRYVLRGLRGSDIAKLENLPVRTVNWYLEEGGRILGGELKFMVKRGLLREFLLHCQERKKELWFNYSASKSVKDRVRCLQQLAEEDRTALDLAERMRLIEQKAYKLDGTLTLAEVIQLANDHSTTSRNRVAGLLA